MVFTYAFIRIGDDLRAPLNYAVLGIRLSARGTNCETPVESCPISKRNSEG